MCVSEAPVDKNTLQGTNPVDEAQLVALFKAVHAGDPHSYCLIRAQLYNLLGERQNFNMSAYAAMQPGSRKLNVDMLGLHVSACTKVPHLAHLVPEVTLLVSDMPNELGVSRALDLIDKAHITPDTFAIGNPWEDLKWTVGSTPLQLLATIRTTALRLATTPAGAARTESELLSKFCTLINSAWKDDATDPACVDAIRLEVLSPEGREKYVTYEKLYAALTFRSFPPLSLKVTRKRTTESFVTHEQLQQLHQSIKGLSLTQQPPPPQLPPLAEAHQVQGGSFSSGPIPIGSVGLKNLPRIIEAGVLGVGVVPHTWVLDKANRPRDGKAGMQCLGCHSSHDMSTKQLHTATKYMRDNNLTTLSGHRFPPNVILFHWECWCPEIHKKVNDYIRDHPDLDCKWMSETYSPEEWVALLTEAGMTGAIPRRYRPNENNA